MRIAVGSLIAGKYRLEAPLARGGMGAVWIARHVKLGSKLAIKFLDPRLAAAPSFIARFEREARATAAIESPHVVHVQDFGCDDDTPYIVMELLRGEDLRARLRRVGRLSLGETAGLLVQVGKALRRAHEAGIVHRDIKPGNLFLARLDDDEILKILDFGIAKEADIELEDGTRTGELVGSPHYVSPEQARGEKDVDHRSDVWSVGVITYRMVTGALPFPGDGLGKVLSKVLVEQPPPVRTVVPELPEALDRFFARALCKDRDERFQSVRELVDAFVALIRTETLEDSVSPPSWSSIVSVSLPPNAPAGNVPVAKGPSPSEETRESPAGAAQKAASLAAVATKSAAPSRSAPPPPPPDAVKPSLLREKAPSDPPPSSGFDTLMTATGPGIPPVHTLLRLRWIAAGAAVGIAATVGLLVWSNGPSQGPSPAGSPEIRIGSSVFLPPAPSASPALPSSASAPALSSSSTSAPRPASPALSSSSAAPRSSAAATTLVAPAPPGSGTKRKWGF